MKTSARAWICKLFSRASSALCLACCLVLCLAGCTGDPAAIPETDGVTASVTQPSATREPTEETAGEISEETSGDTPGETAEVPTDVATEAPTEPVTEAPTLMTVIDMDAVEGVDVSDYFTRATKCEVSLVEDEAEGKVIRMTTKGITAIGTAKPYAFFKVGELVKDMNGILPNTTEYPHLVMKVRANGLWSRSFSYFGGETLQAAAKNDGFARTTRVADEEGWQYVYLNLTPFTKNWQYFYLNFEQAAGKNGEALDLAEMHFFATAEEAAALCPALFNTYPIREQTIEDYTLKVMSFNVQTENGTQVNFDLRAELLRDLMDQLQPDSIGMQEVTTGWIYRMDTFSFNNSYAGVGEGRTPGGEASSIYYRKDKFDLMNSGTFWLSETPDQVGSSFAGANYPRICTWAHLKDKTTGYEYIHLNTHLDHNGNNSGTDGRAIRTSQVRVILEFIQTLPDLPMVLTGDFNQAFTSSKNNVYAMFKNIIGQESFTTRDGVEIKGNFSDARTDAKNTVATDAWASMIAYWQEGGSKYDPAHKPIDYVFYTTGDFDAMVYRNIHYHRDGIYMSDHLPQYCELHVRVAADDE